MKGQDYRRETRLDMYECGKSLCLACVKHAGLGFDARRSTKFRFRAVFQVRVHNVFRWRPDLLEMNKYARRQIAAVHGRTHVGAGTDSLAVGFSDGLLQFTRPICLEFVSCRVLFPVLWHEQLHVSTWAQSCAERDESALPNEFCSEPGYDPDKEFFSSWSVIVNSQEQTTDALSVHKIT